MTTVNVRDLPMMVTLGAAALTKALLIEKMAVLAETANLRALEEAKADSIRAVGYLGLGTGTFEEAKAAVRVELLKIDPEFQLTSGLSVSEERWKLARVAFMESSQVASEELDAPKVEKPKSPAVLRSEALGVAPQAIYWYTRHGGIDALNAGELIVAKDDFKAYEAKPSDKKKIPDVAEYVKSRQALHVKNAEKRFQQKP